MRLVHIANLAGGAFFALVGFANLAHGTDHENLMGGMLLSGAGCLYIFFAVSCLFKKTNPEN